jgi:mannose-6-phosphate isomerase-like protein (cupin superfamily)
MLRNGLFAVCLMAAVALAASDPPGFDMWSRGDLQSLGSRLSAKVNAQKVATQSLAKYGDHQAILVHREGTGDAELHRRFIDLMVIESGSATLVVGGKLVDPRTVSPGEVRGGGIEGGSRHALSPGDVVRVPADTPHRVVVGAGNEVTYLVVKIPS